jgi:hypothetical protein
MLLIIKDVIVKEDYVNMLTRGWSVDEAHLQLFVTCGNGLRKEMDAKTSHTMSYVLLHLLSWGASQQKDTLLNW